ncbi:MAG: acetyl-CoA carboxylase, biotin carboxyl carrier protein [Candidatus Altiarchaeales archaeon WOR_SM1_79]|nr:MAG: acetyl-CoA carboxylase, biotin carboxyl carrier protein [Candidatus Altiarchaeales archaeon WOR_SM1_79]
MRPKEIKKLIALVEESNINELEVSRWGRKVRILKSSNSSSPKVTTEGVTIPGTSPVQTTHDAIPFSEKTVIPEPIKTEPEKTLENIFEVKSPMVGTFYRAPASDADPYVQVGDIVATDQVLCIIEAMKLMNEIESEVRGRIEEILVENAQPVEYNQVLFRIEKL